MFDALPDSKPDAILALMAAYREDPRTDKIDLGVGVYKDADGKTPVLKAIKQAETALLAEQDTKTYVSPVGSVPFSNAMIRQVLGGDIDLSRARAAQAVGGSGALRVLADLMKSVRPDATIWVSDPTWPNHVPLLGAAGFTLQNYRYYDGERCAVDFDGMIASLEDAAANDIVVLHGCCHNPTGADLDLAQWEAVAALCERKSLFPLIDLAYQGFGEGLEEDAAGTRLMVSRLPEVAIAASCSKNLGMYRERVGAAIVVAASEADASRALGRLGTVIRSNYSMPPDHGANATERVLSDASLRNTWTTELEEMRQRMESLRVQFADTMRKRTNSDRFDYVATQKGMFSRLPLTGEQITRLREEHGVYIVGDGRINVAGLPENDMDRLAEAITAVL